MSDQPGELAGRPAIFADVTLAPPVTSFVASKALSRSVNATKAHDMTLAGGASLNGGIFLVVVVVDKALKGSTVERRWRKLWKRSEGEGGELRDFKGREPLLLLGILPFHAYEHWVLNG
jgi:hypothetical protein